MMIAWVIGLLLPVIVVSRGDRLHCQPTQSFSGELISGEFKSPGFPIRYLNSLHCIYEIEPLEEWAAVLNVEFFQTENLHDTVEIYQTYNYNDQLYATKHAILSGIDIPQTQFFSQINGGLRIIFSSDFSEANFPGFKMSFQRYHPVGYPYANFDPCPEIYHQANQSVVALPFFHWRYSPRNSCVFQVNSTESIELQVNNVKANVKIDVYETENFGTRLLTSTPLGSYNGFLTDRFPAKLTSRTGSFIIIINMMSTIADFSSAFDVTYQQVPNPCACSNAEVSLNYTEIEHTSPGWPGEYCDRLRCVTRFKKADGLAVKPDQFQSVLIEFKSFKVEAIHDLFELYSGNEKLKLLTPHDEMGPNMISYFTFPSDNAMINFTSDDTIVTEGYRLGVKLINRPKECRCPGNGDIIEPKGNLKYRIPAKCGYIDCLWTLAPPVSQDARYRIVMMIWFNIGSWSEFIEISGDHQVGPNLNTIRLTPSMVAANESGAGKFVSLHSDEPVQLWYHREDETPSGSPNPNDRLFHIDYRWSERCQCGNLELTAGDEWLSLQSPDFPTPYCDGMNCTYVITAPEDLIVSVNVTFLDLEYNMDTLTMYDGPTLNHTRLELLTGIEYMSDDVESSGNQMTICFSSDLSMAGKGFRLFYKAKKLKQDYDESGGFGFFKVFLTLAFLSAMVVGSIYLLKKYQIQTGITLPSFPSFQLNTFDSQRYTSSLNSLIRSNNDFDNNHI